MVDSGERRDVCMHHHHYYQQTARALLSVEASVLEKTQRDFRSRSGTVFHEAEKRPCLVWR